jgi:prohibitin 1
MKEIFNFTMLAVMALFMVSCGTDNEPGVKSMYYNSWGSGLDTAKVYSEGFHMHAPWAEHIQYDSRNQTRTYSSKVMDKNGTEVTVVTGVNYSINSAKMAKLHLTHGANYAASIIDVKVKGAIKDVAGRYTYEELYGDKREALETEIEDILTRDFAENYLILSFVEVADVNLPAPIAQQIIDKEKQKQKNLKSRLMEEEKTNLAKARVVEAEGFRDAEIAKAQGEAEAIKIKNKALSQSPKFIELVDAEARLELSKNLKSIGNGNVFNGDSNIVKLLGNK